VYDNTTSLFRAYHHSRQARRVDANMRFVIVSQCDPHEEDFMEKATLRTLMAHPCITGLMNATGGDRRRSITHGGIQQLGERCVFPFSKRFVYVVLSTKPLPHLSMMPTALRSHDSYQQVIADIRRWKMVNSAEEEDGEAIKMHTLAADLDAFTQELDSQSRDGTQRSRAGVYCKSAPRSGSADNGAALRAPRGAE